jgi:aryl-alcohol dehydrogenase-like predicted oxidoreductase
MPPINKRQLGKTNLEVTELGLGGVYLTPERTDEPTTPVRLVRRALELGINFFDTAPIYGGGHSQSVIGQALDARKDKHILSSKCGRWGWEEGPYRQIDAFKSQLEQTLKDLHRDSIDIFFIHEADWAVYWQDMEIPRQRCEMTLSDQFDYQSAPVTQFLIWAKEQNIIRYIGISGNNSHLLAKVLEEFPLRIDAILVAFQYSLIWRNAREKLIPLAKEKGAGVILGSPLQQGKLAVPHLEWLENPPDWMNEDTRTRFQELYEIQNDVGMTLAELGLRYLLADPDITSVIPGTANINHLEKNVQYALAGPLPDELHEKLAQLGKVFPGLWGKDF